MVSLAEWASVPTIEIAKQQAIFAIRAGRAVVCTSEHYQEAVRAVIFNQGQMWLESKDFDLTKRTLAEVIRLDKQFGIGK